MLGKKTLLAVLVLGLTMYHAAAQDDARPPGPAKPPGQGPDIGTARPPGKPPGPPGGPHNGPPGGPRPPPGTEPVGPPSRPRPRPLPVCAVQSAKRRVGRSFSYNGRTYRCYGTVEIRGCVGTCMSQFFTNPETLAPENRSTCCKPRRMGVRTFPSVVFQCPGRVPDRRFTIQVPVAQSCGCRSC